jgi:hypothetical protein
MNVEKYLNESITEPDIKGLIDYINTLVKELKNSKDPRDQGKVFAYNNVLRFLK